MYMYRYSQVYGLAMFCFHCRRYGQTTISPKEANTGVRAEKPSLRLWSCFVGILIIFKTYQFELYNIIIWGDHLTSDYSNELGQHFLCDGNEALLISSTYCLDAHDIIFNRKVDIFSRIHLMLHLFVML